MMESEFQMHMMGELTFFLGIQVKQTKQGTFVHQTKYTNDLMKKFNMTKLKSMSTPMSSVASLGPDKDGEVVDQREYMSMIDSLLYLTVTQPDIQFAVGLYARFQASPRSSQRTVVFSEFSGISNTVMSLGFSILLLLHWILLAFPILILRGVGLTERSLLGLVIFLDLLLFAGLLENNLQLHSPPPRLSM
jgi:hypothetical protein